MRSGGVLELSETGYSTEKFVISFISLAIKFIAEVEFSQFSWQDLSVEITICVDAIILQPTAPKFYT